MYIFRIKFLSSENSNQTVAVLNSKSPPAGSQITVFMFRGFIYVCFVLPLVSKNQGKN